jgi:alkylation response protein AidB-like acyl-CoA dehydrogenase
VHIGDSPDEAAYRQTAAAWLGAHATLKQAAPATDGNAHPDLATHIQRCREWQRTLYDGGWAGITWPKAFGGQGGSPIESAVFAEEQARYDVSVGAFSVAIGMVGPTLIAHGTDQQRERFLDPMLRGDHIWCQLFSEPGAGSDLASLATRADPDGSGGWIVNGQKVWTSFAQFSQYGIVLARTNPDVPKRKGITYFVVDMTSPGIEIRPLRQITGIAHFNEVFLSDVHIPAENVIGSIDDGWTIAQTTLLSERALIGGGLSAWTVGELVDLARAANTTDDPIVRDELARAHCREATLKYLGYRLRTAMSQRRMPGPEMLVMKLALARHYTATTGAAMRILGPGATLADDPDESGTHWRYHFLNHFAVRLGGGTDEVQANIIAERGLGLPRDPADDPKLPWKDLVRS